MNNTPIAPKLDLTSATKETGDENAIDLAIHYTKHLPNDKPSHFYASERIKMRCAALSAAYALRRIFKGQS